ncbi:hypothetical protein APSETT444_001336 [Aspergillus pseudonomiae]
MWISTSPWLPGLYGLVFAVGALAISDTDPDFKSVRTKFVKDYSGTGPSEPATEKYFHESSRFEDFPVKIPFEYVKLLEEEYGSKALTATDFQEKRKRSLRRRGAVDLPVRTTPLKYKMT